ncbi:DUF3445 domain-containing protein [bacterium]|nr:MAG: DUF3445 domain-containing protein [bacterium]
MSRIVDTFWSGVARHGKRRPWRFRMSRVREESTISPWGASSESHAGGGMLRSTILFQLSASTATCTYFIGYSQSVPEGCLRFTPWIKGIYEVAPGLKPFGTDFGNGEMDRQAFPRTDDMGQFLENKRRTLRERRGKYARAFQLDRAVEAAAARLIAGRLAVEHPDRFRVASNDGELSLSLDDTTWELPTRGDGASLDLLARLVAEDLAVVRRDGDIDWTAYLHVCAPSHWAPEDKIGRSFFETHDSIPGFERVNAASKGLLKAMVESGPWVRFTWGPESDDRLNHHPEPPAGEDPASWNGRIFRDRFWVRWERQTLWPLPEVDAALFTIRVGSVSDEELTQAERAALADALQSMTPAAREYKGLTAGYERLLRLVQSSPPVS